MILCDIGNTTYHFFYKNQDLKLSINNTPILQENDILPSDCIYYISVNKQAEENLINNNFCIDLKQYIDLKSQYDKEEIGIDRLFACYSLTDGVIVDAGSAITIDVIEKGVHLGGYIMPGISSYSKVYSDISDKLNMPMNFGVDMQSLPLNTKDAISAGVLHPVINLVKKVAGDKTIYTTGGDGKFFSRFFDMGIYDKNLIFKGMERVIKDNNLLEEFKI